jgi:hypothetical protein
MRLRRHDALLSVLSPPGVGAKETSSFYHLTLLRIEILQIIWKYIGLVTSLSTKSQVERCPFNSGIMRGGVFSHSSRGNAPGGRAPYDKDPNCIGKFENRWDVQYLKISSRYLKPLRRDACLKMSPCRTGSMALSPDFAEFAPKKIAWGCARPASYSEVGDYAITTFDTRKDVWKM